MLVISPHEILNRATFKVMAFDETLAEALSTMAQVMKDHNGIGIAANQLGFSFRAFIMQRKAGPKAFVNPQIWPIGKKIRTKEGCLSIPGEEHVCNRYSAVRILYQDKAGRLHRESYYGEQAQIIQHEMDHLNGLLINRFGSK